MRHMSLNKQAGFTLIEMLVIAPILLLVITGFIALMVGMVGDVLVTRDRNAILFDTQSGLAQIEQDVRLSTEFRASSGTLTAPQGSDSNFTGTASFSSTNSLVLTALATEKNPLDSTRQLIYYANQPNACGSDQSYNRLFLTRIVYYVKNGSLWRRTIVPPFNTNVTVDANTLCGTPWQRNTCSPGYTTSPPCQTNDTELIRNVDSFNVNYYSDNTSSTPLGAAGAQSATVAEVTVNSKKTTAGRDITYSNTVRSSKLNSVSIDLPLPGTPALSYNIPSQTTVNFTWAPAAHATSYDISYNINGGAWTNVTVGGTVTTYTVSGNHNDTITFKLTARNATGSSSQAVTTATIPRWVTCNLLSGWQNYSPEYSPASYTRTSAGVVELRGMIRSGTATNGTVLCSLPAGYRPTSRLVFSTTAYNGSAYVQGRVDVNTNGDVIFVSGASNWISMEAIKFIPSGSSYIWSNNPLASGWTNFGSGYATTQSTLDSQGRVFVQGFTAPGTTTSGTVTATLPTNHRPAQQMLLPTKTNNTTAFNHFSPHSSGLLLRTTGVIPYLSNQAIFYPSGFTSWNDLSMQNSWIHFGGSWTTPQYAKGADDLVVVKGLVKKNSGTAPGDQVIAQLPPGYRPKNRMIFGSVISSNAQGSIDVQPDGDILVRVGTIGYISLDEIVFVADQ